MVDNMTQL